MAQDITLRVNGREHVVKTDPERSLLEVLREDLQLTGTKYGCGEGECGACTVLADRIAIRSCITSVAEAAGQELLTIEGLATEQELHPVQQAFLDEQAMQCGYCIPGQIMTAVALLSENPGASRNEIVEAMSGNICRCCNYNNILQAVAAAASPR